MYYVSSTSKPWHTRLVNAVCLLTLRATLCTATSASKQSWSLRQWKGTLPFAEDVSLSGNIENVQIFSPTCFIRLFHQYLYTCSAFISAFNLCFSGRSHAGLLSTNEEQKNAGVWRILMLLRHLFSWRQRYRLMGTNDGTRVFGDFHTSILNKRDYILVKSYCVQNKQTNKQQIC